MLRSANWKIWVSGIIACLIVGSALLLSRGDRQISDLGHRDAPDSPVVAEVNGEPILASEFRERATEIALRFGPGSAHRAEVLAALKRSILEEMIERRLLLQEAAKRAITVSEEELERATAALWEDVRDEVLAPRRSKVDRVAWVEKLREMLIIDRLMDSAPGGVAEVTEEEIANYYEAYVENYQRPRRVRLLQIMVDDEEIARRIRQQLTEGADFAQLARAESLSPDSDQGGEMGIFAKGDLQARIERVVFRLKINTISKVVKTDYGYHIFKVTEIFPAKKLGLSEARDEIAETLLRERQQELFQDWLDGVRDAAVVTIHEDVLAAAQIPIGAGPGSSADGEQ